MFVYMCFNLFVINSNLYANETIASVIKCKFIYAIKSIRFATIRFVQKKTTQQGKCQLLSRIQLVSPCISCIPVKYQFIYNSLNID